MEYVLVVKTEKLSQFISGRTGLITESNAEMLDIIRAEHEFIPRPDAENDPGYKQIIPYVVLRRGDEIFMTRRLKKGGEARLHGLMSIGVGGHINPVDDVDRENVLLRGLERELDEEVEIEHRGGLHPSALSTTTPTASAAYISACATRCPSRARCASARRRSSRAAGRRRRSCAGTGICSKPGRRSHSTASRIKNDQGEALTVSAQSVILET
ncbi:MAG: hypothetical protein V8S72_09590 [Oscillospiraceae bacterium]